MSEKSPPHNLRMSIPIMSFSSLLYHCDISYYDIFLLSMTKFSYFDGDGIYRNSVILLQISLKLVVTPADWLSVLDDLQLKRMIQRDRLRWRCWWWWRNI